MKKRRNKSEKTKIKERIDKLFSLVIRTRDRFHCQKEGCPGHGKYMQAAHCWSRRHLWIRWDIRNSFTFCYYHHQLWSHREPVEFAEWCKERLSEKLFYELRDIANNSDNASMTIEEMLEIEEDLKAKLEFYQKKNEDEPF